MKGSFYLVSCRTFCCLFGTWRFLGEVQRWFWCHASLSRFFGILQFWNGLFGLLIIIRKDVFTKIIFRFCIFISFKRLNYRRTFFLKTWLWPTSFLEPFNGWRKIFNHMDISLNILIPHITSNLLWEFSEIDPAFISRVNVVQHKFDFFWRHLILSQFFEYIFMCHISYRILDQ